MCRCHARWGGAECATPVPSCPDDFACLHGGCNADGACECDAGYTGDDCSLGPFFGAQQDCSDPAAFGTAQCRVLRAHHKAALEPAAPGAAGGRSESDVQ